MKYPAANVGYQYIKDSVFGARNHSTEFTLSETEGLSIDSVTKQPDSRCHLKPCPELNEGASERSKISRCSFAGVNPEQSQRAQGMARNDKKKNIRIDSGTL